MFCWLRSCSRTRRPGCGWAGRWIRTSSAVDAWSALGINPANKAARDWLARLSPGESDLAGTLADTPAARKGPNQWMTGAWMVLLAVVCISLAALAGAAAAARVPTTGPLHETPYVIVYGREGENLTEQMTNGLDRHGVPYTLKPIVDHKTHNSELLPRMKAAGL